jgi:hypothetical protein
MPPHRVTMTYRALLAAITPLLPGVPATEAAHSVITDDKIVRKRAHAASSPQSPSTLLDPWD